MANIFRESEIKHGSKLWIVDLSSPGMVNPDCYWRFEKRKDAIKFAQLIESGKSPREAQYIVVGV